MFFIILCIMASVTLGLVLALLFVMYRAWHRDFYHRVTRSDTASPSNMKRPRPQKLDMDHIYISFWDYLWVSIFVGLSADINWALGLVVLKFRERFCQIQKPDYNSLCGQLALETNFAINFTRFVNESGTTCDDAVAEFCIEEFTYVINSSRTGLELKQEKLRILIQLDTKKGHQLLKAWVGSRELTAQEAYMFITFRAFSAGHVLVHSVANWGVDPENSIHPFLHRMSVITVMYNYYGQNGFNRVVNFLQSIFKPFKFIHKKVNGLPAEFYEGYFPQKALGHVHVFNMGMQSGVIKHSSIVDLMPYSRFVSFIVKVRNNFGEEFKKHEKDFMGIDVEGLFAGTIIHSLDHTQAEKIMKDPLWIRSEPDMGAFQWLEEWCRFVRSGFVDDLRGIFFTHRFKEAPHPFFKAVYEFAYQVDPELADKMDCCIIK